MNSTLGMTEPEKSVPFKVAPDPNTTPGMMALLKNTPFRWALVKSAWLKSVPNTEAAGSVGLPSRLAFLRLAPVKVPPDRLAALKMAKSKVALDKSAFISSASEKSAG